MDATGGKRLSCLVSQCRASLMLQSRRGRRTGLRLLPFLATLLSLLTLGLGVGGWKWLNTSLPQTEGETKVLGLMQPVTIARDKFGVPFISAQSEQDAYFALGYAHAQDRLWQMELQRRIASGNLSEIAGRAGLANDRFFRTLGLQSRVDSSFEQLDERTKQDLSAYVAGVNALIAGFDFWRQPPIEFLLAGIRPKPWRPSDALLWPRVMALQLAGNWRDEILNLKLLQRLGPKRAQELTGMRPDSEELTALPPAFEMLAALPPAAMPRLASNVWAVNGDRSATGAPLLANDPHLGFQAPIPWYLASLETPELSVKGATLPGSPFVLLGQNKQVAWGMTSVHGDTMDLFVETIDAADATRYMTPDGPVAFLQREEIISVKGEADVRLKVRETRHGPIISDALTPKESPKGVLLALAATALNPHDKTADAMRGMSLADNAASFRQALSSFQAPAQYVAYAAADGRIALQMAGLVPLRHGDASPDLPRRGEDGRSDWRGFVPFLELPSRVDPEEGYVLNANESMAAEGYPHHLNSGGPDGLRAERLTELLNQKTKHGPDDMNAYQMDNLSMAFVALKPYLQNAKPNSAEAGRIVAMLGNWDGSMARDLVEPTLFSAWAEELQRALFLDDLRKQPQEPEDQPSPFDAWSASLKPTAILMALEEGGRWCDDESTADKQESCDDILARSLDEALRRLKRELGGNMKQWRWGNVHRAKFSHGLLERLPVPESWVAPVMETDGDGSSLNRGSFAFGNFKHVHGAGLRAIYDLKSPEQSRFVIACGQSGNPLSAHYDDQLDRWRDGDYLRLDGREKAGEIVLWPLQGGPQ